MSLTITHTHAAGTLIDGTGRADGSAEVLKTVVNPYTGRAGAWRWSRNLGSWYVARSRDSRANTALVDATKAALEAAGFTVAVEIDDTYRSAAEAEADAVARQEDRGAVLGVKAERTATAADAAEHRARELSDVMPLGQPILVGHHSDAAAEGIRQHREIQPSECGCLSGGQDRRSKGGCGQPHHRVPVLPGGSTTSDRTIGGGPASVRACPRRTHPHPVHRFPRRQARRDSQCRRRCAPRTCPS